MQDWAKHTGEKEVSDALCSLLQECEHDADAGHLRKVPYSRPSHQLDAEIVRQNALRLGFAVRIGPERVGEHSCSVFATPRFDSTLLLDARRLPVRGAGEPVQRLGR